MRLQDGVLEIDVSFILLEVADCGYSEFLWRGLLVQDIKRSVFVLILPLDNMVLEADVPTRDLGTVFLLPKLSPNVRIFESN